MFDADLYLLSYSDVLFQAFILDIVSIHVALKERPAIHVFRVEADEGTSSFCLSFTVALCFSEVCFSTVSFPGTFSSFKSLFVLIFICPSCCLDNRPG